MTKFDAVANIAVFLMERSGSVLATWTGRLTAAEQREMFGAFLGKGELTINGEEETIRHTVKVCFGLDYNVTFESRWHEITATVRRANLPEFSRNANKPRF